MALCTLHKQHELTLGLPYQGNAIDLCLPEYKHILLPGDFELDTLSFLPCALHFCFIEILSCSASLGITLDPNLACSSVSHKCGQLTMSVACAKATTNQEASQGLLPL